MAHKTLSDAILSTVEPEDNEWEDEPTIPRFPMPESFRSAQTCPEIPSLKLDEKHSIIFG